MIKDGVYLRLETMSNFVRLLGYGLGLVLTIFNEENLVYANLVNCNFKTLGCYHYMVWLQCMYKTVETRPTVTV